MHPFVVVSLMNSDVHAAIHANRIAAAHRVLELNAHAATDEVGGWLLVDASTPEMPVFNQAMVAGQHEVDLTTPERWYADRGSPFRLVLRDDDDSTLIAAAMDAGYRTERMEPALFIELVNVVPALPSDLEIREVSDAEERQEYGAVGWRRDGLEHIGVAIAERAHQLGFVMLLGRLGEDPVATSMAVLTGGLVGLYNVRVESEYRRRGLGAFITWAAVEAGRRRGATTAWAGATEMGHGVYEGLGFRPLFSYNVLVREKT